VATPERSCSREAHLRGVDVSRGGWPLHDISISNIVWYITGGRGEGASYILQVWAITGWGGVPKQRVGAQRTVLIRAQKP